MVSIDVVRSVDTIVIASKTLVMVMITKRMTKNEAKGGSLKTVLDPISSKVQLAPEVQLCGPSIGNIWNITHSSNRVSQKNSYPLQQCFSTW